MKAKISHYQSSDSTGSTACIQLMDFHPGCNNERVFWSSKESGFNSYVLVSAKVTPGVTFKQVYFITPDGKPVQLISVNGCGEERWLVYTTTQKPSDLEAIAYWDLRADESPTDRASTAQWK